MFCMKCGNKLADNAKFCIKCGTKVAPKGAAADYVPPVSKHVPAPQDPLKTPDALEGEPVNQVGYADADERTVIEPVTADKPSQPVKQVTEERTVIEEDISDNPAHISNRTVMIPKEEEKNPFLEAEKREKASRVDNGTVALGDEENGTVVLGGENETGVFNRNTVQPESDTVIEPQINIVNNGEKKAEAVKSQQKKIQKKEKKQGKGKAGLIVGISAALFAVGAAAVGFFCFSNELMRVVMGDDGFAKFLEGKSFTYLNSGHEVDEAVRNEAVAGAIENYFSDGGVNGGFTALLEQYGDFSAEMSIDVEAGDALNGIIPAEELQKLTASDSVISMAKGENGNYIFYTLKENGQDICDINLYSTDDRVIISAPDFTGSNFYYNYNDVKSGNTDFDTAEAARITQKLTEIYFGAYEKAEISFRTADYYLGGETILCEEVRVHFSSALFAETVNKMAEFLKNDEYLKNYYILVSGNEASDYEAMFEVPEGEHEFTVINYTGPRAELLGKRYVLTEKDAEGDKTGYISFVNNGGGAKLSITAEDGFSVEISDNKNPDSTSGSIGVLLSVEEMPPFKLDITYSGADIAKYNGKTVNTGSYVFSVAEGDEFLSALFEGAEAGEGTDSLSSIIKNSRIEWNTSCDGASVTSGLVVDISSVAKIGFNSVIKPFTPEFIETPDDSAAIDLGGDLSGSEYDGVKQEVISNIDAMGDKSSTMAALAGMLNAEGFMAEYEKAKIYKENFSAYTTELQNDAQNYAEYITGQFNELYSGGFDRTGKESNADSSLKKMYTKYLMDYYSEDFHTVKLYFDESGAVKVIDDGGIYFVDFNKLSKPEEEQRRNLYVEFTIGEITKGSLSDIYCVMVYTDDLAKLPSIPDGYDIKGGGFEVKGEDVNGHDGFVMAIYPAVTNSAVSFGEDLASARKETETYDKYAREIYNATSGFFNSKPMNFYTARSTEFSVIIEKKNGKWAVTDTCRAAGKVVDMDDIFADDISASDGLFISMLGSMHTLKQAGDIKAEIIFSRNFSGVPQVCGVTVIPYDSAVQFSSGKLPYRSHYMAGYSTAWNGGDTSVPCFKGIMFIDGMPRAVGSYCASTKKPLGDMEEYFKAELEK